MQKMVTNTLHFERDLVIEKDLHGFNSDYQGEAKGHYASKLLKEASPIFSFFQTLGDFGITREVV